jgi:TatD DNase family protein
MWIDSHCHLNHEKNADHDTPESIAARAQAAGVDGMLTICCEIATEFSALLSTVKPMKNVWCSVGTHPHDAGLAAEKAVMVEDIMHLANSDDKVIGIGESGLDYFYDFSPRSDQEECFRKHIRACMETGLPLIVHARDADSDIIRIIRDEKRGGGRLSGVMHCFSSGPLLAEAALEEGFYISFSGIVTFPKSTELQAIAKTVPLDRLLVETDAPFLSPAPHRGKVNEPAFVKHTGRFLADLLQIDEETIVSVTKNNFFTLFDKAKKTWVN